MALPGLTHRMILCALLAVPLFCASGCSSPTLKQAKGARSALDTPITAPAGEHDPYVAEALKSARPAEKPALPPSPGYQPVSDDVTPAKTRLINIQSRGSTLGDMLHVIAEAASLNLIIGDSVNQDKAVTISLKRVTPEDALTTLLESADYFYSIRDNTLTVEATGTKTFELGHTALVQGFDLEVGGNILGSATGGSSSLKGTITQTAKGDAKAFDFWDSLEKTLQAMLGKQDSQVSRAESTTQTSRTTLTGVTVSSEQKKVQTEHIAEPPVIRVRDDAGGGEKAPPQQSVFVNRQTGTVMITATRRNLQRMENYLETLRKALNRQVMLEARIIEVQLDDSFKYGIDWNFLSNIKWFNSTGALYSGFGGLVGTKYTPPEGKSPSFQFGYVDGSVSTLLSALKTQGEVKTLSNPRINVMNGQTALLTVGRNRNYISKISSTTTTATGSTPTVTYTVDTANVLSGIILGLAPYINNQGEISLTVTPIISELVSLDDKKFGNDTISIPTVDLRELSTTIKIRDGEMIVIGGLISSKVGRKDEKVPLLGDIPWLGTLFTRKDNTDTRSELVVVLQPHLIVHD